MADEEQENPFASVAGQVDYGTFTFRVSRHILASLCESAVAVVPSRESAQRPDLGCFQVKLAPGALRVAATDTERTVVTVTAAVHIEGELAAPAQAYIPARRLAAILKEAPEGDITIAVAGNKAAVTASSGASWDLLLPGAGAYPQIPSPSSISFVPYSREKLLRALRAVRHAVCRDGTLASMTQLAFTVPGAPAADGSAAVVTATDGNRMARAALPGFPQAACVPASALDDLVRVLSGSPVEQVGTGQTDKLVAFSAGHVVFAVLKRFVPFPDVDAQLLKKAADNGQVLSVDKEALASAVRRVRINASTSSAAIALELAKGEVTVIGRDGDNAATETVPASWDGEKRLVTTSHVWLSDALAAHPEAECKIQLGKDAGKRRSVIYLAGGGVTQVVTQLPPALVGY